MDVKSKKVNLSTSKYNLSIDPKSKLSKLHLAVVNEDLDKVRKYVQSLQQYEGERDGSSRASGGGSLFRDFRQAHT